MWLHALLLHAALALRVLIVVVRLFVLSCKLFFIAVVRYVKAAADLFAHRPAQRVLVHLPETGEMHPGIVIMSYRDGCDVEVEVSKHPPIWRECFFTREQLRAWNPKRETPRSSALVLLPVVLPLVDCMWGLLT